jgi:uncharacterized protein
MNLKDLILEQNHHWRTWPETKVIYRHIIDEIKLNSKFIEVITGIRRSGKSVIFDLLMQKLSLQKYASPEEILKINFDHPLFVTFSDQPGKIDEIVNEAEILSGRKIKYIFLDEIQNVAGWEKWVKNKYDQAIFKKIFITGSNANLLSGQYTARLSGRYFSRVNYPFSFKEFLTLSGITFSNNYKDNYLIKNKLVKLFFDFLKKGGFPDFLIENDLEILKTYYQTILLKDVIDSNQIRDSFGLKQVAYYLISNTSELFSYNQIAKNLSIHENTVKEYIEYLKEAYLFFDLKKYDFSLKKQNLNKRKIYCVDNGLARNIGFSFSENSGKFLENLVFIELIRRKEEVYYYSDKQECDFVIKKKNKIELAIQVCFDINEKSRDREIKGLMSAMDKFNLKEGLILTANQEEMIKSDKKQITIMPVWRWLLEK